MASITPSTPSSNPQLTGITGTAPMPRGPAPTLADGSIFNLAPNNSLSLGGNSGAGFQIIPDTVGTPPAAGTSGQIVVGGGSTPPGSGAQPPAPGTTVAGTLPTAANTATTPVTTTPATTTTAAGGGDQLATSAAATSGFGKAERSKPMVGEVDGAKFSFPSFKTSAKSNTAPEITWGPGWKRVEKDGMWYMENAKGTKAIPAVEYRVTPSPAEKVQTVKVANGWGKKFPDGTILVFDRNEGAYRLDAKGNKVKVPLGTHTFGGVKVRVFEASVVRTLEPNGVVNVFTSRGQHTPGTTRGRLSAALGNANAGASVSGGGKTAAGGPTDGSGGKVPGTTVAGGGAIDPAKLTQDVDKLTGVARGILDQVRAGTVDPAKLAELQAQLGTLPAGLLQAAGAAGTMTSDGRTLRHGGEEHGTTPATTPPAVTTTVVNPGNPGTTAGNGASSATGTPPAAGTTTAGGGAASASGAPVAGVDANATTRKVAAGTKFEYADLGAEFKNKQARFGQLPEAVQAVIAKQLGSDQGSAALKADQLVAFGSQDFSLVDGGTVYTKAQAQIRGAGPGEDMALTVRPTRQPGASSAKQGTIPTVTTTKTNTGATTTTPKPVGTTTSGGGGTSSTSHAGHTGTTTGASNVVTVGGGVTPSSASTIKLFGAGASIRSIDFGGLNGSFTWKTLPKKAQDAILAHLRTEGDAASKAFASRTGSGWTFDPNAVIVIDAGFASFVGGLSMSRKAATGTTTGGGAPASGGQTTQPVGHDATRPPVTGGGAGPAVGSVSPGTAPPVPVVGGGSGSNHSMHMNM